MDRNKYEFVGVTKEIHEELVKVKKLTGIPIYKQIEIMTKKYLKDIYKEDEE